MDHRDQTTITSGGHESHGVHVCRKCGWPFPNPHPSSRYRRAHKKICGTIEGYKLVDSEESTHLTISDEDHLSDDDLKTPSPKVLKRSKDEKGSGEMEEGSGRSEYDVFSDAVTEFPGGFSPGYATEIKEGGTQTVNDTATADIIQSQSISPDSSQVQNCGKPEGKTNQLGSTTQLQDHVPGSIVGSLASSISDFKAKESAVLLSNDGNTSSSESYPIKPEPPADALQENEKSNAGENMIEDNWQESVSKFQETDEKASISDFKAKESAVILSNDGNSSSSESYPIKPESPADALQENEKSNAGENMIEDNWQESVSKFQETTEKASISDFKAKESAVILSNDGNSSSSESYPIKLESPADAFQENEKSNAGKNMIEDNWQESVSKFQETDEKAAEPVPDGGVVQPKEDEIDGLGPKMFTSNLSPEVESAGNIDATQIGENAAQRIDFPSSGSLIDGCKGKGEGIENVHVLSIPDDIPVLDHPEIMVEGFKDYKGVKLHQPADLDSGETVKHKEDAELILAGGVVQPKEEQISGLGPKMFKSDISPEVESAGNIGASAAALIGENAAQVIDFPSSGSSIDGCKGKGERSENALVLSIPDDIPIPDHPEIMVEGFKDYEGVKLHQPVGLDSGETVKHKEDTELIPAGGVVQPKEEHIDGLGPKMFKSDLSPEVESSGNIGASATAQIDDAVQVIDFPSSDNSIEGFNGKEGSENVHVLSVPEDIPVLDHPEIMVEGFKDYKEVNLHQPVNLDSHETVKHKEYDAKDPVSEENYSSHQLRPLGEVTEVSALKTDVLEDNPKQETGDSKLMVKEVPVEGEASASQIQVTITENHGSDEQGAPADAATAEMEKSHTDFSSEEQEPHNGCGNSFQTNILENATKVLSDVNPVIAPMDAEVNQAASLVAIVDANNHEKAGTENRDITDKSSRGAAEEYYSEKIIATPESYSGICFQVHPMTNSLEGGNAGHHEHDRIQKCDSAGVKDREGPIGENDSMETKTTPVTASSLHESEVVAEDVVDGSGGKIQKIECTHMDGVSDLNRIGIHGVSEVHEGTNEHKSHGSYKVQSKCVEGGSVAAALCHSGDDKLLQSTSEDHMIKEPLQSSLDNGSSIQSSAAVKESDGKEFDRDVSGISSESYKPEDHSSLVKQQLSALAVDVSVDSFSQTDSLEGNWGSVSDAPAFIDSETLPSTGSQASAEAMKTKLKKPNSSSEGQCSDKSDIFEAPSFMTLVEPKGGVEQKADASEIQTVLNPQQSKAASLQAGWFPSITNVVNESQGRKKNEEIIAKVTNWSTGKQHTPLKSLLGEANVETKPKFANSKEDQIPLMQKDETPPKDNNGDVPVTLNSILGPESPAAQPAKIETGREWDSPARYPSEIKREKRKVKSRPYWAQYLCCSSAN